MTAMFLTSENEISIPWVKTIVESLIRNRFDNWFKVKSSSDEVKIFFEKENILSLTLDEPCQLSVELSSIEFFNYLLFSIIEHLAEQINGSVSLDKNANDNRLKSKYPSYKEWLLAKSSHLPESLRALNVSMILAETNELFRHL